MTSTLASLVVGLGLMACASERDGAPPDGATDTTNDTPPFTLGVSMLSGHADPGNVDGERGTARLHNPVNCAVRGGVVYVADFDNSTIRAIDATTGTTSTVIAQDNFRRPFGMVFAPDGTLFVSTDRGPANESGAMAGTIWRVDLTSGTATVVAANIGRPRGLAVLADGRLAVTDYQNQVVELVDPSTGAVTALAGTWRVSGLADGVGGAAKFSEPYGVVVKDGTLIVADYGNHSLREVALDGTVRTLAGNGLAGYADGALAGARFGHPQGLAISEAGNIYLTDLENYRVREITTAVATVAGDGIGGYADSDDLLAAEFYGLEGLCVEGDGSRLYVADGGRGEAVPYNRIRRVELP